MTARSAQHEGEPGWFTSPQQVNQRRYEALRAYFVDGLSYAQAGARFGYTRWAMINLVREHRAGKLELFAPPRRPGPAPGTAPARDRVRGRVIALRRQGLSSYEISARLAAGGTPLNRQVSGADPKMLIMDQKVTTRRVPLPDGSGPGLRQTPDVSASARAMSMPIR